MIMMTNAGYKLCVVIIIHSCAWKTGERAQNLETKQARHLNWVKASNLQSYSFTSC